MIKKYVIRIVLAFLMFAAAFTGLKLTAEAKRDIVIVIDPGHGGTNMGARHNGVIEKEATMQVAVAMKEELEKYDGVVVYLTRTGDDSLELIERAQFARDVKADILLSLHFNMSELHDLHGSEMWISSQGALRTEANRFAKIEQMLLSEYGIETRGCFTRLNDEGSDYYGVIRESAKFNIPAVIVEHCYLDRPEEYQFYDTDAALDRLGRIDATAVAMAYNLSSEELGVDYSRHYISNTALPEGLLAEDVTAPELTLDIVDFNENTNALSLNLKVTEEESSLVYYQYSFNNGKTFSDEIPFYTDKEVVIDTKAYPSADSGFIVRAYNAYGLYTDTEIIDLNLVLFGIDDSVVSHNKIFPEFITEVVEEVEQVVSELPPEVQTAAKWTLILGGIGGFVIMILLILQRKIANQATEIQSEAKGA